MIKFFRFLIPCTILLLSVVNLSAQNDMEYHVYVPSVSSPSRPAEPIPMLNASDDCQTYIGPWRASPYRFGYGPKAVDVRFDLTNHIGKTVLIKVAIDSFPVADWTEQRVVPSDGLVTYRLQNDPNCVNPLDDEPFGFSVELNGVVIQEALALLE